MQGGFIFSRSKSLEIESVGTTSLLKTYSLWLVLCCLPQEGFCFVTTYILISVDVLRSEWFFHSQISLSLWNWCYPSSLPQSFSFSSFLLWLFFLKCLGYLLIFQVSPQGPGLLAQYLKSFFTFFLEMFPSGPLTSWNTSFDVAIDSVLLWRL